MDEEAKKKRTNHNGFFDKKFPFHHANPLENYDLTSIHSYVQNVLAQATVSEAKLSVEVFETHQSVIAKVRIPKQLNPRSLRIMVNSTQIRLEKTQENKEQIIHLPCRVDSSVRKAVFKQGILEIRISKLKTKDHFHEVFIRY